MSDFTIEQVISEVRSLAEKNPEKVYGQPQDGFCKYVNGPQEPGCIFGHALVNLGMSIEEVAVLDDEEVVTDHLNSGGGTAIGSVLDFLNIDATTNQKLWCSWVQSQQDNGRTWASAVSNADYRRPQE